MNSGDGLIINPNIDILDLVFDDDFKDKPASNWSISKIGTLQAKMETILSKYQGKKFRNIKIELPLHRLLSLANESFGYDGWSSEVIDVKETEYVVEIKDNGETHSVKMECTVKITLKDGTYHEDTGIGRADNLPSKSMAYMKAKKSSVTDATKNAIHGLKDIVLDHEQKLRSGYYDGRVKAFV
ncbi:DNA repair protein [Wickerhamomyces ciferrii]|uniref:DNA repair protein n=1 Tax=Wickerhamomyces ciferrii (strain ATCC 14091 / BCRC 22168 / CBS 111 / JCM 3599 / NBRC 0793 / NRRL Y-1031 F-60-10) TaxID=1206466 RepID=K0KS46_WICCF|nr:DNA repair protein [Wickerhamomyces ciferrii]CCH44802.1 DNA repair protein [Wickerhamomyces ciferrii]